MNPLNYIISGLFLGAEKIVPANANNFENSSSSLAKYETILLNVSFASILQIYATGTKLYHFASDLTLTFGI